MSTLMVHMQLGRSNRKLLSIAGELANDLNAAVIGIAACRLSIIPTDDHYSDKLWPNDWELEREIADAEREFDMELENRSKKVEWRSTGVSVALADYVAEQSRSADLVITGIDRSGQPIDPSRDVNVSDLLVQLGRPILVVPSSEGVGDIHRIIVGWKNTREARRAVFDALPLLKRAKYVGVCEVAPEDGLPAARAALADVIGWLERNEVTAVSHAILSTTDDAVSLNAIATDQGAGIIVAGAFGHSKLGESIFGGTTKTLLERCERCLFFSH